jgi:ribosomal protein L11 methylase PrmA
LAAWPLLLALALAVFLGYFFLLSFVWGAGFEPTPRRSVEKMLELLSPRPGETLYDLGSGIGTIVLLAAERYEIRCVGIELDPLRYLISLYRRWRRRGRLKGSVEFIRRNFYHVKLSEADMVTLFLTRSTHAKLEPKLQAELRPGARVATYYHPMPGWKERAYSPEHDVYLYVIGGE